MKVFRIDSPGKYSIVEQERPVPGNGEVLLRVQRLGFCGSDLSTWRGLNPMVSYPRVIGHEISGTIESKGQNVPERIKTGMLATLLPYTSCGECSSCRKGRSNACRNNQTMGVQRDGASCDYITVKWEKLVFAEGLSLDELVMVEPLSVGFHAVRRAGLSSDDFIAVIGCGMVGLGAVIAALAITKNVIAIDIADDKLELVREIGVRFTINSSGQDIKKRLDEITGNEGPDVIIEAAGKSDTFRKAIDLVSFAGRVVYIGYVKESVEYETRLFVMKELDIRGSRNASREDFDSVIRVLQMSEVNVNKLITRRVTINEAGKAISDWSDDPSSVNKIILEING